MSTKKKSGSSNLKFFSEDSAGMKIQPKTVLIISLIYIGIVVLLHIYAKLSAPKAEAQPVTDIPQKPTETNQQRGTDDQL